MAERVRKKDKGERRKIKGERQLELGFWNAEFGKKKGTLRRPNEAGL